MPAGRISVPVSNGFVTLKGQVDCEYQRSTAETVVRDLPGVRGVSNLVTVVLHVNARYVKSKIETALRRSAEVDSRRLSVGVDDSEVVLSGHVHSWFEAREARLAAWSAPGVKEVDDRLTVTP